MYEVIFTRPGNTMATIVTAETKEEALSCYEKQKRAYIYDMDGYQLDPASFIRKRDLNTTAMLNYGA